jgi:phosphoribosylaminoimidazole carboxylase
MKKIVPVHPSWRTLRLIQNKYEQKEHFSKNGIAVAPQLDLSDDASAGLAAAAARFGFPFMVKAKRDSYDGRGNFRVAGEEDFPKAIAALGGSSSSLYAEKWVPFSAELSVMVVRTEDDQGRLTGTFAYPPVETVHEDSICSLVFMPPRASSAGLTPAVRAQAQSLAERTVASLWGRGVFAVEMFLTADAETPLVVNEVAPRPHNSGHHTIEAVPQLSQFKAQLYSILDMVPREISADVSLAPRAEQALMVNILGGAGPDSHMPLVDLARARSLDFSTAGLDVHLHLYGKEARPNRKIGHVTVISRNAAVPVGVAAAQFIECAAKIRQERLSAAAPPPPPASPSSPTPLVVVTMGSDSDMPVLRPGLDILAKFNVPFEVRITSAHRTPHLMTKLGREAAARGVKVLIAAAGGAAHLPGMLASETPLPVIGVPVRASQLDGMDSLLSIVQMPVSWEALQCASKVFFFLADLGCFISAACRLPLSGSTTRQTRRCLRSASSLPTTRPAASRWTRTCAI